MKIFSNPQAFKFLSGDSYAVLFSLVYAFVIGSLFYPGLLYSDSVGRWNTAIQVANSGLGVLTGFSDHHPVFPIILMAASYKVTGELGFFSIVQVFLFSISFFSLVRHFSPTAQGNFFSSIALLLPVSQIYSIFISYDSLFAVFLMWLILSLLSKGRKKLILVPIVFSTLVGARINSVVILPLVIFALLAQSRESGRIECLASVLSCIFLSAAVLYLPTALNMQKGNSWLIGTAWEYANMATKIKDERHIEFLRSFGASPTNIEGGICYHGIWCGKEREEFIDKVGSDRGAELVKNYTLILVDYPRIFMTEKLKYIKSLMGIGGFRLSNAEIGRWREDYWKNSMKPLGFETSKKKEEFINRFFDFSNSIGQFLFRPWVVFLIFFLVALYLRTVERNALMIALIPAAYYGSFFITSQNHEFRYFFPVVLIFFAYISSSCAIFLKYFLERIPLDGRKVGFPNEIKVAK